MERKGTEREWKRMESKAKQSKAKEGKGKEWKGKDKEERKGKGKETRGVGLAGGVLQSHTQGVDVMIRQQAGRRRRCATKIFVLLTQKIACFSAHNLSCGHLLSADRTDR